MTILRKKLIEVSLPLDAINKASAHEKAIRVGHPSTLHLWWARRPLATCRAVLFALLVDDPSSWPEEFPTEFEQRRERERLHRIIERIVPWEATKDKNALVDAQYEIAKSLARARNESPPMKKDSAAIASYIEKFAPPVCDPFCGGGSIPFEAHRLGLHARGSDLNPVAVMVSKATCELANNFIDTPPVNPKRDLNKRWMYLHGLVEDILWYGDMLREMAYDKLRCLYPKILVTDDMVAERPELEQYAGEWINVVAWHWARTVVSPDPIANGLHVPLVSTFILSSKPGQEAIIQPIIQSDGSSYKFTVKTTDITDIELDNARCGTKSARGANFTCLVSGSHIASTHIKKEGTEGRIKTKLMAMVAEGNRERLYFPPNDYMVEVSQSAQPYWRPEYPISGSTRYVGVKPYGIDRFDQLFTDRQLVTMATLSDLIPQLRQRVLDDAISAGMPANLPSLSNGGVGADAYADAVATYLGLCVSRQAGRMSNLCCWHTSGQKLEHVFSRQVYPIVWNFCEANPFCESTGSLLSQLKYLVNVLKATTTRSTNSTVIQQDAAYSSPLLQDAVVATDPPYYDNIPYSDISDFYYVWQRKALGAIWPELYRRVMTPKDEEIVAFPHRHGSASAAEVFFMRNIEKAFRNMYDSSTDEYPIAIYYAFKQSVVTTDGLTSLGWAAFLQGLVDVGYTIERTWPIRTESPGSLKKKINALASSIVLICRKRSPAAPIITRSEFKSRLLNELPSAINQIHEGNISPVDVAQAVLGAGMGIFTAASKVIEHDDTTMTVHNAIALINQVRDEIYGNESSDYDGETRFCIEWFEEHGWETGKPDDAEKVARPNDVGMGNLTSAGVVYAKEGVVRLVHRNELLKDWNPATDKRATVWKCAQHLVQALISAGGGIGVTGVFYSSMKQQQRDASRKLAFRLYDLCERNGWATEAQVWNVLIQEWPAIEAAAANSQDVVSPLL